MITKLEDSLNGGYGGLYGEIVTEDIYGLKKLPFVPDVIFDLGANVGIFTRFARELFPQAKIIAVEPHPENIEVFKRFTPMDNVVLIEQAIGTGNVYRHKQDLNGAHESYIDSDLVEDFNDFIPTLTPCIMPSALINFYFHRGQGKKAILKMDIEGNEQVVFNDIDSMIALFKLDYVAIELHNGAYPFPSEPTNRFSDFTTWFEVKDTMFYAIKKSYGKI